MKTVLTEQETINKIAGDYARAGYEVLIPGRDKLPRPLQSYQPDLIVRGPTETVVVEVKLRRELAGDSQLSAFADQIRKLKNWRFELHIVEAPRAERQQAAAPAPLEGVSARLDSVALLLAHKDPESALVIAWSAFESVLQHLTQICDVPIRPWNSQRAVKQLLAVGCLRRSHYELFMRGLETRNHIVHGGSIGHPVAPLVKSVAGAIQALIEECRERVHGQEQAKQGMRSARKKRRPAAE